MKGFVKVSQVPLGMKKAISARNRCSDEAPPGTARAVKTAGNRNTALAQPREPCQ